MANEQPAANAEDKTAATDAGDRASKAPRTAKTDKPDNAARAGKPDASGRTDRVNDTTGSDQSDKAADAKPGKSASRRSRQRSGRSGRSDTPGRSDSSARPAVADRSDASGRSGVSDRADTSGRSGSSNRSGTSGTSGRSAASGRSDASSRFKSSARPAANTKERKSALRWTWREYALQLSVVIVGIVVTFVGSDLISRWSRQRQVKTVMQLVVSELERNREQLCEVCTSLYYDQQGMLMLQEYDLDVEAVPLDSLDHYRYLLSRLHTYRPQQDALEVLKSSDVISAVGDKQLLVDILGCYNRLNDFREQVILYSDRKREAQNHLFANSAGFSLGGGDQRRSWRTILADPMCAAFLGTSAYFFGFGNDFDEKIAAVDSTIALIETKYRIE